MWRASSSGSGRWSCTTFDARVTNERGARTVLHAIDGGRGQLSAAGDAVELADPRAPLHLQLSGEGGDPCPGTHRPILSVICITVKRVL
jgi:hypothetical protein